MTEQEIDEAVETINNNTTLQEGIFNSINNENNPISVQKFIYCLLKYTNKYILNQRRALVNCGITIPIVSKTGFFTHLLKYNYNWLKQAGGAQLQKFKMNIKFNATSKKIALDEFSYKAFENALNTNKRLNSTNAIRYANIIVAKYRDSKPSTEITKLIAEQYLKLLWEKSTKSLEFSKWFVNYSMFGLNVVVKSLNCNVEYKPDTILYSNNGNFRRLAYNLNMPSLDAFNRNNHIIITSSKHSYNDLTIAKAIILNRYIQTVTTDTTALCKHLDTILEAIPTIDTIDKQIKLLKTDLMLLTNQKAKHESI